MTSIQKIPDEYIPPDIERQKGTTIDVLLKNIAEYNKKLIENMPYEFKPDEYILPDIERHEVTTIDFFNKLIDGSEDIDLCEKFEAPDELPEHRKGYDDDPNAHVFGNRKWDQEHVDVDKDYSFNWSNEDDDGWDYYSLEAGESREWE
jgi:hypothetical protein